MHTLSACHYLSAQDLMVMFQKGFQFLKDQIGIICKRIDFNIDVIQYAKGSIGLWGYHYYS